MSVKRNKQYGTTQWQEDLQENERVKRMESQHHELLAIPETSERVQDLQGQHNRGLTSKMSPPGKTAFPPPSKGLNFPDYGTHLAFLGHTGVQFPVRTLLDPKYLAFLKGKKVEEEKREISFVTKRAKENLTFWTNP